MLSTTTPRTFATPPMFASASHAGLLAQPFPHVATYRNGFWLVHGEHKRALHKVRALRDWLLGEVRRAAGDDPCGTLQPLTA